MIKKIPKIIHLIWLGGQRPTKFQPLIDKIKNINFDYQVIEWSENNLNFELINQELFDKTINFGAKSDILRFELLYKFGGIYMDFDFLQVKKFDDLLNNEFFCGAHNENEMMNSIVGSVPNSEIVLTFLKGLKNIKPLGNKEIERIMYETGPYYLTKIIKENKWDCNYKILVGDYFYPFPGVERHKIKNLKSDDLKYVETFIKENTYCIHLYTTTWQ